MTPTVVTNCIASYSKLAVRITYFSLLITALCIIATTQRVSAQAGTLDPTFNPTDVGFGNGDGLEGLAYGVAFQPDGKIILGGQISAFNRIAKNNILRLNEDGTLDNTFNAGTGSNNQIRTVTLQGDGKIIIGGFFTSYNGTSRGRIARLNTDGSLDNTFDPGTGANSIIYSAALQGDGKIIIVGEFTSYNGTSANRIARLNSDGSLDNTFNSGTGANSFLHNAVLQADGKVVIAGNFTSYNGISRGRIARLNSDGSLDNSFDPGTGANQRIMATTIQEDGKIIISGEFTSYNGTSTNHLAKLNADGSLDLAFSPGTGSDGAVYVNALQEDGKILIGGNFSSYNGTPRKNLARLNSDGSLDLTFNTDFAPSDALYTIALQADGKIIISGNSVLNGMARLNSGGSLDLSFNMGTGANSHVASMAFQPDGKILIGGNFMLFNGIPRNGIARLNSDGSLDLTFNPGTGIDDGGVYSIALQSDGKIIIAGQFAYYNGIRRPYVARLNADGSLDPTFNPGNGPDFYVYTTIVQEDGKVLFGGLFSLYDGVVKDGIVRVNPDGSVDNTFDTRDFGEGSGPPNPLMSIALQGDGKIVAVGSFNSYDGIARKGIVRINSDGTLDNTFDTGTALGSTATVYSLAVQEDGKTIVSGYNFDAGFSSWFKRLNTDGSVDNTFNSGTGPDNPPGSIIPQEDGRIIIGGSFTTYNGTSINRIARLNADGTLDLTFDPGAGPDNTVSTGAIQSDGNLIIAGPFTSVNGVGRNRIARLFNQTSPTISAPTITEFSPMVGPVGTSITISGTNFDPQPANNIVYFGATRATVNAASPTQLMVTVPIGATYQPISVTANGLTGYSGSPFVVTFLSSGVIDQNSFAANINFVTGSEPYHASIADLDGDGKSDIVVGNYPANTVSILRNTSASGSIDSSSFAAKVDFLSGEYPISVCIGDVDGDGKQDLVVLNNGSNTLSVFRNVSTPGELTTSSFATKVDFATENRPSHLSMGDIDGDGRPDLVLTNQPTNTISIFRNTSEPGTITAGSFAPRINIVTATRPSGTVITDFDADNKPDIAVVNTLSGSMSLFKNVSIPGAITSSSFLDKVDFATPDLPVYIAAGDLDVDGKKDIVVSTFGTTTVSVFRNTTLPGVLSSGSFAPFVEFSTASGPFGLAIADLDGDGKPDLAVANQALNVTSLLRNTSSPGTITTSSFAAKVDLPVGGFGPAVGDLDGDGKPDLVTPGIGVNAISVFRNVNTLTLAPLVPSSGISFSEIQSHSMNVGFTAGDGAARLAVIKEGSASTFQPLDSTSYTIGQSVSDGRIAYVGSDSAFTLTDLLPGTTYYLTLFEFNSANEVDLYLREGAPTAFTTTLALPLVYVTTPVDGALDQKIKLNITARAVTGATTYTIEVSTTEDFSGLVKAKSGSRTQTFDTLNYSTLYYARVKTNLRPDYGKVTTFSTVGPEDYSYITSPANNATNVNLTINVTANIVPMATTYVIELNTSPTFESATAIVKTGTRTQAFTPLAPSTVYYGRVKTDLSDTWGATRSFTTRSAASLSYVTSPANNAVNVNTTVNVTSTNVPGATQYTIQLSEAPDFSVIAFETSGPTRTLEFSGLKYNTQYYNRVFTNLSVEPGEVRSFSTRTASSLAYVTSPANGAINISSTVNVSANTVPDATEYTIQLSEFEDFSTVAFENTSPIRTISFGGLKYNTTYYNRVKTNLSADFGQTRSFTTIDAAALAYLNSPADGSTNVSYVVNLVSRTVPGASQYTIEANTAPDFSGTSIVKVNSSPTIGFQLEYDQLYYVRVQTNLSSNWGPTRSFTTGSPISLAYVSSPVNGGTGVPTTVNVSSNLVSGASTYTIELNTAADFNGVAIVKSRTSRTINFSGLLPGITYYARVSTNLAPGAWGPMRYFSTAGASASARSGMWEGEANDDVVFGELKVEVYPNPFGEKLTIYVETPAQQPLEIAMVDVTGKEVHRAKEVTNSFIEINEALGNGVYMLNLKTGLNTKIIRLIKADK